VTNDRGGVVDKEEKKKRKKTYFYQLFSRIRNYFFLLLVFIPNLFLNYFSSSGIKKINDVTKRIFIFIFVLRNRRIEIMKIETLPNRVLMVRWDKNKRQYANLPTRK